jgi:[amino group carrier protein]-lysine/ornithine hydrolase
VTLARSPFDLTTDAGARALLEAVVRLPSPSGAEAPVAEALVAALTPYADAAYVDEVGNAVAVVGRGARRVTLLGHLDTVPGEPPVHLSGGVLHGRGTVDAKGSAVALAVALARASAEVREALELRFVGAVEEEAASSRGARHAMLAYPRPDLLIVGEPSGWSAFTLGYKGSLRVTLSASRAAAHGSRPDTTAAEAVVEAWCRVRAWAAAATPPREPSARVAADAGAASAGARGAPPPEGAFERLQVSLLALSSDHDGLSERAGALLGWRLPPAWPPARVLAALETLDLGPAVAGAASAGEAAVRGDRDGELARAFRAAIRAGGGAPGSRVKMGTSDWNVVAPVWDCDTVAYGPGDASFDHTPDERITLDDVDRSIGVLERVLASLATPAAVRRRG